MSSFPIGNPWCSSLSTSEFGEVAAWVSTAPTTTWTWSVGEPSEYWTSTLTGFVIEAWAEALPWRRRAASVLLAILAKTAQALHLPVPAAFRVRAVHSKVGQRTPGVKP